MEQVFMYNLKCRPKTVPQSPVGVCHCKRGVGTNDIQLWIGFVWGSKLNFFGVKTILLSPNLADDPKI